MNKVVYNFLHDKNKEDLIFIRMLVARRPWEAPSNQITNTWQSFTEALRIQQDSKGQFPFKTLRSRFQAYLTIEKYWSEKVDPGDSSDDEGDQPLLPSKEIRNGLHDIFEMVRNHNDSKTAAKDEQRLKEMMECGGQVDELKARALLHLNSAFDGVASGSKSSNASDDDRIPRNWTPVSTDDDGGTSRARAPSDAGMTADGLNQTTTPS